MARRGTKIGLNFNWFDERADKKEAQDRLREEADLRLFNELTGQGYSPEQSQYMIEKRNKTGVLDPVNPPAMPTSPRAKTDSIEPEFRREALGIDTSNPRPLPNDFNVGERSTVSQFPQKKMSRDEVLNELSLNPRDVSTTYVNANTGDTIRTETSTKGSKVVKVGSSSGKEPTKPKTPEEIVAANDVKIFQKKAAFKDKDGKGYQFTQDDLIRAENAFEVLGIPYTPGEVVNNPGILGTDFFSSTEVKPPVLFPKNGKNGAKSLAPELAKEFLQKAGNDKNKARELAKKAGYSF